MLGDGFVIGQEISKDANAFFWILMFFNLSIFGIIIFVKSEYIKTLFNTVILNRYLIYNSQETLRLNSGLSLLFTFTYFTTIGAGIARFTNLDWTIVVLIVFGAAAVVILKIGFIFFTGFISNTKNGIVEHVLNHHVFFQTSSFILTLILLFSFALPEEFHFILFWICGLIVVLGILFREFQSLLRAVTTKVSVFYIILYLCTLEIIPFLIVLRVIASENAVLN